MQRMGLIRWSWRHGLPDAEHPQRQRALLWDDPIPQSLELRVPGQTGDSGDVAQRQPLHPFDERGAQPLSSSSQLSWPGSCPSKGLFPAFNSALVRTPAGRSHSITSAIRVE
jgi:hypothetical protein